MAVVVQASAVLLAASCVLAQLGEAAADNPHLPTGIDVVGNVGPSVPAQSVRLNNGYDASSLAHFRNYCRKLCKTSPCPKECTQAFLDPWTMSKRSARSNGLSFDDYLFMRWLGRDMIRAGMRR